MTRRNHDIIEVEVVVRGETDLAFRVTATGRRQDEVWVPKSQVEIERDEIGPEAVLQLPEWLAIEKGLV